MASKTKDTGDQAADLVPLCRMCHEHAEGEYIRRVTSRMSANCSLTRVECLTVVTVVLDGGLRVPAWPFMKDKVVLTEDASMCAFPWCPDKPEAEGEDDAQRRKHVGHCTGGPPTDPDVCDCEHTFFKELHVEILSCINRMERSFEQLTVAEGVTFQLSKQIRVSKGIDPAEPPGWTRYFMDNMANISMNFNLNGVQ